MRTIDGLNSRYGRRFRLFKGIEANIRPDGTVDMEPHELRLFEFVVASPHSLLRKSVDQTARMVGAVSQPGVCHPWPSAGAQVQRAAGRDAPTGTGCSRSRRAAQVAIEIDGSWDRQDVHYALAARALELGCLFALDSDAHAHPELDFADIAIAHARLAGIPAGSDRQLLAEGAVPRLGAWRLGPLIVVLRRIGSSGATLWLWSSSAVCRLRRLALDFLLMIGVAEGQAPGGKLPGRAQSLGQLRIVA